MFRRLLKYVGLLLAGKQVREALDREYRYSHHVSDARHWMSGSFPEVADAMLHIQVLATGKPNSHVHDNPRYMSAQDCYTGIDQFRERMRNKYCRDANGNTTIPPLAFDVQTGFNTKKESA